MNSLFKRLKKLLPSAPARECIGDGMWLIDQDRDNWFVSFNGKTTAVYAPENNFFSRKRRDYYGVFASHWQEPCSDTPISDSDKKLIERTLFNHLTDKGFVLTKKPR